MSTAPAEETFEGAGGLRIHLRSWRPDEPAKAVVAICHGFNSHGGQYAWVSDLQCHRRTCSGDPSFRCS